MDKFLLICEKADTKEVQKYFNNHNNLQLNYNDHEALYWFCNNNNTELIEWYLNNQYVDNDIPNFILNNIIQMGNINIINIFENYNCVIDKIELLKLSCRYNNNKIFSKIINEIDKNDVNNNLYSILKLTVTHNEDDLTILKKLIEYNITNDLINKIFNNIYLYDKYKTFNYLVQFFSKKVNLDIVFYNICSFSKIEFVELFYNIFPDYDFSNNSNAVIQSFHNDNGEIIEFLLKKNIDIITIIKSNIISFLKIEELFENEFISLSNLILAYLLFPNIDVTKNSNIFFIKCCKENRVEWADFIFKKYPHKYYLEIEENKIINWSIKQDLVCSGNKIVTNINQCPICLTKISNCITDCEHQFCYECLNTIYNRNANNFNCSLCRKNISNVLNLKLN